MFGEEVVFHPENLATVCLVISSLFLLYKFAFRNLNYWEEKGIPHIKGVPFLGNLFETSHRLFHEVEIERYNKFGKLYGHFEGNEPLLSLADPILLRDILLKDFWQWSRRRSVQTGQTVANSMLMFLNGEDWKRVRNIVSPTLTTGKIKKMMSIFKDCSKTFVQNLKILSSEGKSIEVLDFSGAFALDVIASSAFSTKLDSHNDPENEFVQTAKGIFSTSFFWRFGMYQLMPKVMKFLRIPIVNVSKVEFFKMVTLQIMEERKRTGQTRNDFLQFLMDIAEEKPQNENTDVEKEDMTSNYGQQDNLNNLTAKNTSQKNLSIDELVAQCVVFFLAGYDTTRSSVGFTLYLLALNPEEQEKLYQEIKTILSENKGELTYESLQKMKYLDNVISESLRMYPPATRVDRRSDYDYKLGDTELTLPKGMIITIPICAIHKDPEYFPNPDKFNPDSRFTPEERSKRDPFVFLPFGQGPRNCIGMRFALMEMKVCLAYIVSYFKIKRCTETKVPVEIHVGPAIMSPKSITLQLKSRNEKILLK